MEPESGDLPHARPAIEFTCCRCSRVVRICQCCWRNQKYCSPQCSRQATLERHRRNQKTYRMTAAGQANHKVQQQTYRARKKNQE
jgi:hypothetical protein